MSSLYFAWSLQERPTGWRVQQATCTVHVRPRLAITHAPTRCSKECHCARRPPDDTTPPPQRRAIRAIALASKERMTSQTSTTTGAVAGSHAQSRLHAAP